MESEAQFKICLKPFLEMVRLTNLSNSLNKKQVIEDFKKGLIERDICGVKSKPLLLDKLFDEVLEH